MSTTMDHKWAVQVSSNKEDYPTPIELFKKYDDEFHFNLDPCASPANAKCDRFFTYHDNGLAQDWGKAIVWMNPPYNDMLRWMNKAYLASRSGATVVCLVPSRTSTQWWHKYAIKGEIRFIEGRITFEGQTHNAPFCSSIVIFRPPA